MTALPETPPTRLKSGLAALAGILLSGSALATPPTVALTDPADGATWPAISTIYVAANATDTDGTIARVEFYLNSVLVGSSQFPESGTLGLFQAYLRSRPQAGTYALTARAYDSSGEATTSAPRTLQVSTLPALPVAATGPAMLLSSTAVKLSGTLEENGYANDRFFEFGLSTSYGGRTSTRLIGSPDWPLVERYVSQLERSTTYHYRLVVQTDFGVVYGADATFTTGANFSPTASDAFANVPTTSPVPVYCDFADVDGEPVSITGVSTPSHGVVEIGSMELGGDLTYTPDATFDGTDEFTYTVADEHGGTATATVRLGTFRKASGGQYATTIMTEYGQGPRRAVGSLGLHVTATGRFSGVVRFFAERYPIRGQFSVDGFSQLEIDRHGQPPMTLNLSENGGSGGIAIAGNMHASSRDYEIISDTALSFPTDAPEAGAYTFALPPSRDDMPQGNGYVVGRVSHSGAVLFVGRIGDGQAFSFGSQLRRGGSAQFYVTAGAEPRDRLSGKLQFPSSADTEASGNFSWFKAPRTEGFFQAGFGAELTLIGSRLLVSAENEPILDYTGETIGLDISFADWANTTLLNASLAGLAEDSLQFQQASVRSRLIVHTNSTSFTAIAIRNLPSVDFHVNRARGIFYGSFTIPAEAGRVRKFSGVFLQHPNSGSGLVAIGDRIGSVKITPR